jgi:hypothetical protein
MTRSATMTRAAARGRPWSEPEGANGFIKYPIKLPGSGHGEIS